MQPISAITEHFNQLVSDMQEFTDRLPLSVAIYNQSGNDFMAFLQTADMLELYKRNGEEAACGVLLNIESHHEVPSKYGCNLMIFTGVDKEVGNVITFGIGLLSNLSSVKSAWWIIS